MIDIGTAIRHYKKREVQDEIIYAAQNKEAVARFGESFGHRPDILKYPRDILQLAQKGATSFHASEELWSFPHRLSPMMPKQEIEELRTGWDLVLDIDCAFLDYSMIAAEEIMKKLRQHGIASSISIKFSGNKGLHIGIPFEAFPETISGKEPRLVFPDAARIVAAYLKEEIKDSVKTRLIEKERNITEIIRKTGKEPSDQSRIKSTDNEKQVNEKVSLYIESFLNIDTVLISSRHLYRMPYSLHEKSGLVSTPLNPSKLMEFDTKDAHPDKITVEKEFRFLCREKAGRSEAQELFDRAYYLSIQSANTTKQQKDYKHEPLSEEAIPEQFWPPCIKKIMLGLEDGRKRALFILINFLSSCGWEYKEIEQKTKEWNHKNKPPLGEPYILGQLEYYKQKGKRILPPNCSNPGYYSDMQIKCPEQICNRCKNPSIFAKKRGKAL
ncbi:hypothetical protein HYU11_01190 [Candidatus Woesearchaeota archaeon]|nr:hypothetical protein [Candidatus Woesearchaeota archaeon]